MPVVFVPSLINPPHILDLAEGNSLLRWLAGQGLRPLLVDWGVPRPTDRNDDLAVHVARLAELVATLPERPALVGYCLGGTIATAAAARLDVRGLASIASPWRFDGFGADARRSVADLWSMARPVCEAMGLVPMEVLQSAFWRLDPVRTIAKFEAFAALRPGDPRAEAFVTLEDWANDGAPVPLAAARELFEELFAADLPGTGGWAPGGTLVDPKAIGCPIIGFVATGDRIVPAATALELGERHVLPLGHVGMVIGGRAPSMLWQPLADWLSALPASR